MLAAAGIASRRRAEELIRAGRVEVNGVVAQIGARADPARDRVTLDGEAVRPEPQVYWMLHKPRGVLSTVRDPEGRPTVLDLISERRRVFPVGRLDRDTRGLLLLTNDGPLTQSLLHPSRGVEREYVVHVAGELDARALRELERGVWLEGRRAAPAQVSGLRVDPRGEESRFHLTLVEGRKRQIRRSCASLGHPVRDLLRVRFGALRLGGLPVGDARRLRAHEVAGLRAAGQTQEGGSGAGSGSAGPARKPGRKRRVSKASTPVLPGA